MIDKQWDNETRYFRTTNPVDIAPMCKKLGFNFTNAKIVYQPDNQFWYVFI